MTLAGKITNAFLVATLPLIAAHAWVEPGAAPWSHAVLALAVAGVATLVARLAARRWIEPPIARMVEQAARVGRGDLDARLAFGQHDELGRLAAVLDAMCDGLVAERVARQEAREHLRHTERLARLGKLASGVAHELGTPLHVIAGRAKMLASPGLRAEDVAPNAEIIARQTERMTRIVRQLLDFARRRSATRVPADLRQVVRQGLTLLEPLIAEAGATLRLEEDAEPVEILGDRGQLQQVLSNLVTNGIQAMPRGGTLTVRVDRGRARPPADLGGTEEDFARIAVQDQGEGISSQVMPQIFEPFFTTKRTGEGTGLGLSITYGIVQEHSGWIAAESEPGRGSRFVVYLPLEKGACAPGS